MEPLPLPKPLTDRVEYQVNNAALLGIVHVFGSDGIVREVKAKFDNGAVLRMTVAVPYPMTAPVEVGDASAGPPRS